MKPSIRRQYLNLNILKNLKKLQLNFGTMKDVSEFLSNDREYSEDQVDYLLNKGMDHSEDSVATMSKLKKGIDKLLKQVK